MSPAVANTLRSEGINAATVLEASADDDDLLRYARNHDLAILTNDQDFLNRTDHYGVFYYDDQDTSR